ncbi:MAG: DNA primase [Clostridia bacterium]|nr:MAG: DNA primase [Clostridia bacterium]
MFRQVFGVGGPIPPEIVAEVRERADIVEVIGAYVALKKQGQQYVGLCPFHQERTPSFTVSPQKQMFYCFGCGAGGNVFTFLMQKENLSFPEAVRQAAEKAGIFIPEADGPGEDPRKEKLLAINELAAKFYHQMLADPLRGAEARKYLAGRKVKLEAIKKFSLGYAPGGPEEFLAFAARQGFSPGEVEESGLAVRTADGRRIDRFRQRLIFPITDRRGRVIGFGGRVLGEGSPKYLNTPETVLFQKRRLLYGLSQAAAGIRQAGYAAIVEGYVDVIAAHQYGITWAVASLGTALTLEQARLIREVTSSVCIAYDGDRAGEAATWRGLEILQQAGLQVRIAEMPVGEDPDTFLQRYGSQEFQELLERKSRWLIDYKLEKLAANQKPRGVNDKMKLVETIIPDLARLEHPGERIEYARVVSERLGVSMAAVLAEMEYLQKQDKKVKTRDTKTGTALQALPAHERAQGQLLAWMVQDRDLGRRLLKEVPAGAWADPWAERIAMIMATAIGEGQPGIQWSPATVLAVVQGEDTEAAQRLAEIIWRPWLVPATEENINANLACLKSFALRQSIDTLKQAIRQAEESNREQEVSSLLAEVIELEKKHRSLRFSPGKGGREYSETGNA